MNGAGVELDTEQQKELAARAAAELVQDGQVVGLGSGTTVAYLLQALAERAQHGLRFIGVSTSHQTARIGHELGLHLSQLDRHPYPDLDIDGADEVDPRLNLVKGRGGALLREKIVASASRRFVVVVDEGKLVQRLGEQATVPVEIVPFGWTITRGRLEELGLEPRLRGGDRPLHTDNGNFIIDCRLPDLTDPAVVAAKIKATTGVVEHGVFLGMASTVIVGHANGTITTMGEPPASVSGEPAR